LVYCSCCGGSTGGASLFQRQVGLLAPAVDAVLLSERVVLSVRSIQRLMSTEVVCDRHELLDARSGTEGCFVGALLVDGSS